MKRSNLMTGILYLLFGILLLLITMGMDNKLGSLLFGFAFAQVVPGIIMICKYFYWSKPQNRERYKEKLAAEKIELYVS